MDALLDTPLAALIWYVGLLDRLPDFARAMLAGLLLVGLLALSRRSVPQRDVQFSLSFWKISLIILVAVPLVVWLLPATRITVFVERLDPALAPASAAWLALLGLWGLGFVAAMAALARGYVRTASRVMALPVVPEDDKLTQRLRHWQHRLGISGGRALVLTDSGQPTHLAGLPRVVLPRAAVHWPASAVDVLLIQALCRHRKHQGGWHLFAQVVACCYWPLPWVRRMGDGLLQDFHITADNLAAACYQDEPGYYRALRQIQQRMGSTGTTSGGAETKVRAGIAAVAGAYLRHLRSAFRPAPGFAWDAGALAAAYDGRRAARWSEPGEKLAFLIGQSLLVAVLASGATLREVPPEIERDYSITLNPSWMDTAFPDPARFSSPPAATRSANDPARN